MFYCPKKFEAWQQLLAQYTEHISWTEEDLQQILSLHTKPLTKKMPPASSITVHQLVASGLAGIWKAHISRYLDSALLPTTAIYNVMNSHAKKYHALNK
ncbi:hypothetical protein CPB97_005994, partial [Podila verticillata]